MNAVNPEEYRAVRLIPSVLKKRITELRQNFDIYAAILSAQGVPVTGPKLEAWDSGGDAPTMAQARKLAGATNLPLEMLVQPADLAAAQAPSPSPPFAPPTPPQGGPAPSQPVAINPEGNVLTSPSSWPTGYTPVTASPAPPPRRMNPRLFDPALNEVVRANGLLLSDALILAELADLVKDATGGVCEPVSSEFLAALVPLAVFIQGSAKAVGRPLDQIFPG